MLGLILRINDSLYRPIGLCKVRNFFSSYERSQAEWQPSNTTRIIMIYNLSLLAKALKGEELRAGHHRIDSKYHALPLHRCVCVCVCVCVTCACWSRIARRIMTENTGQLLCGPLPVPHSLHAGVNNCVTDTNSDHIPFKIPLLPCSLTRSRPRYIGMSNEYQRYHYPMVYPLIAELTGSEVEQLR